MASFQGRNVWESVLTETGGSNDPGNEQNQTWVQPTTTKRDLRWQRPAEQRVEDHGSDHVAKFSELYLENPNRPGNLWRGNTTFLLSHPPSLLRPPPLPLVSQPQPLVSQSPPFRFMLPSVYDTLERKKVLVENHSSAKGLNRQQTLRSVPECSTTEQVKQARVEYWACVNFSFLRVEEMIKFISQLRDMCMRTGTDFTNIDPSVNLHYHDPNPIVIRGTFSVLRGLIDVGIMKKQSGLLIVVLPDVRYYDEEVEQRCKNLGVSYQTCFPEDVRMLSDTYLSSVASNINSQVLFYNTFFKDLNTMQEHYQSTEEIGDGCVSGESSDSRGNDCDSKEICSQQLEWEHGYTGEHCDNDMGEDGESLVSDEEMCNSAHCNDDSSDTEDSDSDLMEYESYPYEMEDSEESDSEESDEDEDITPGDLPPPFTAAGHVANDNSFLQPWLGIKSTKRDYSSYGNLLIRRGVVVDWACINFSHLGDKRLYKFYRKLSYACSSIRTSFNGSPMETFHETSFDPDNIASTFSNVMEKLSQQFDALDMKGELIGLILVILPEARDFDAKIEDLCKKLGVLYRCLLPGVISTREDESIKKLAYEIKSKVVQRDTFIPFVSEGPTLIFGADVSCNFASVVAPIKLQEFRTYKAVVRPNNGAIIEHLFHEEDGGMISNLLIPLCKKIKGDCRIIFFRHGVTEDHINNICRHEVQAIKLACSQLEIGCKLSITFVVVGGNKDESLKIGKADFVCNHGFVKGTSPARYRVVLDDNNLTFEQLESIIIKLCLLRDHDSFPSISMVPSAYAACYHARQTGMIK